MRNGTLISIQPGSKALYVVSIEGQGLVISSSVRVKRATVCHRQFRHVTSKRTLNLTADVTASLAMTGSGSESKYDHASLMIVFPLQFMVKLRKRRRV